MKTRKIYNGIPFSGLFVEKEIKDSKSKKVTVLLCRDLETFENGDVKKLNVDEFSGKKFFLNPSGFPMNDIMIFEQAQSDSVARAALARIREVGSRKDDGLTLQQRFDRITPSNWSSPAEYLRASETLARLDYADMQRVRQAQEVANQPKPEPAPAPAPTVHVEPE